MIKLEQRSFQKSDPLFAFRSFVAHGRRFNRGAAFDWQSLGISAEKVELLFRSGKVRHYTTGNPEIDLTNKGLGEKLAEDVADPIGAPKKARTTRATT
jgi:hypothetical protein